MYDVAVVGSGPAGSSAALDLASAGADVVLLEKQPLPRYKACGGGLVERARRLLAVDVSDAIERECRAAEINALVAGLSLRVERSQPFIFMAMRETLDYRLACAAREAGVDVRSECEVRGVHESKDRVELATGAETFTARFVVAADGALSPVARFAGWRDSRHLVPALESEVEVGQTVFERFSGAARFDVDVLPLGYGWVFPKRRHLSVGIASFRRGPIDLHALLDRYCERIGLQPTQGDDRHGFVIPIHPRKDGFVRGRVLLAGDAAGLADPITAEGISFAVGSGRLAARVLWETGFDPQEAKALYHAELERSMLAEIRLGRQLARLLFLPRKIRPFTMRLMGQGVAEQLADVFSGEMTYRALLGAL